MEFKIDHELNTPKYQQLIDQITFGIAKNKLHAGDQLPSVNTICKVHKLSRDTVFKAYSLLKDQGIITAVANKGYYIANETRKVFLLLDTFKAYKEVLYDTFNKNLPDNVIVDVHFHHYNLEVFNTLVRQGIGKYSKFVIMPFDNKEVSEILALLPEEQLLIIDWSVQSTPSQNKLFQDFGSSLYHCLETALPQLKKYEEFHFLYPVYTYHPPVAVKNFEKFCKQYRIPYSIITEPAHFKIKKGSAYLSVSDRMLGHFLEQCEQHHLEPGENVGIISYNETPMKKFIYKGITVISTDFKKIGETAAQFVISGAKMNIQIPTKLILRKSL